MADWTTMRVRIKGRVQGVGFRYWTRDRAEAHGLSGWVRNEPDGSVSALFSGPSHAVSAMLGECRKGPPSAAVADVTADPADETPGAGFSIRS